MTDIDPRLRTELGRRAGHVDVTGDFAARAIEIEERAHRRRIATAALGSALALVLTAPLVYSAMTPEPLQPLPASSTPAPTASATPTPTASASPTAIPTFDTGIKPLATAVPELGPAEGVPDGAYAIDGVLHDAGRETPLPIRTNIWGLARLDGGGLVVHGATETGSRWYLLDSAGDELPGLSDAQTVVVSEEMDRLLVSGSEGTIRVLDSTGTVITEKRTPHVPVALLGDLAFAQGAQAPDSMVWNTVTGETRTIRGIVRDVNAARRLVLVLESRAEPDPSETCYSILDVDTLTPRSRGCGPVAPMTFSPQGNYLIGTGTFDGAGPMTLSVVRVDTGRVALKVDDSVGAWTYQMNLAETGVTFSASEAGPTPTTNNALVRCDLSGACVVVGDSRKMLTVGGIPAPLWAVSQN